MFMPLYWSSLQQLSLDVNDHLDQHRTLQACIRQLCHCAIGVVVDVQGVSEYADTFLLLPALLFIETQSLVWARMKLD